jgi:hypothetical protein
LICNTICLSILFTSSKYSYITKRYANYKISFLSILLTVLYQIHLIKRLYECINVHIFSKHSTMNILHYLFGISYYICMPLSIFMINITVNTTDINTNIITTNIFHNWYIQTFLCTFGIYVFIYASYKQSQIHFILRNLRKNKKSANRKEKNNQKLKYHIPFGNLFEYLSSPHYVCEILIYISLYLIYYSLSFTRVSRSSPSSLSSLSLLWSGMILTTMINLIISAIETNNWYIDKFQMKYIQLKRKILLPGLW